MQPHNYELERTIIDYPESEHGILYMFNIYQKRGTGRICLVQKTIADPVPDSEILTTWNMLTKQKGGENV